MPQPEGEGATLPVDLAALGVEPRLFLDIGEPAAVDGPVAGVEEAERAMGRLPPPRIDRGEEAAPGEADPGGAEAAVPLGPDLPAPLLEVERPAPRRGARQVAVLSEGSSWASKRWRPISSGHPR